MRSFLAATLAVAALLSAGCGGGSSPSGNGEAAKSPTQVLADAVKAATAATSVHFTGKLSSYPGHHWALDVSVAKGKGATGTIIEDGNKIDLVVIGDQSDFCPCTWKAYLRTTSAFWEYHSTEAGISNPGSLGGKWVEFSPSDETAAEDLQPTISFADLKWIMDDMTAQMDARSKEATTHEGQSVVAVYGSFGNYGSPKARSLYVASSGTPYPVGAAVNGPWPASVSFDSWGKSVSVTAPSGAVKVSTLGG